MTKRDVLAYLAGILDADGTIGIKRNTYAIRITRDSEQATYSERVCVRQVQQEAIDLLHGLFGGYRGINDPSAKRGKPLHAWQVTDMKAAACLRAVLPFLRIKKSQAENCLALRQVKERSKKVRVARGRGHAGAARRPAELGVAMETLYQRAKALNAVGRS